MSKTITRRVRVYDHNIIKLEEINGQLEITDRVVTRELTKRRPNMSEFPEGYSYANCTSMELLVQMDALDFIKYGEILEEEPFIAHDLD